MGVFVMPSLGSDMDAGTLVQWLVKPGDTVARGDVVAVVETQKGAIEIEVFETGTVHALRAELGQTLPVGTPLAVIRAPGEAPPEEISAPLPDDAHKPRDMISPAPAPSPEPAPATPGFPIPDTAADGSTPTPGASPAARALAREHGVEVSKLHGTGPGGAVLRADVQAAISGAPETSDKLSNEIKDRMADMRRAVATAMARSKREIPHFYVSQTMDLQPAVDWLSRRNADLPPTERMLVGALFVKAAAVAAKKVTVINGHYLNGAFAPFDSVNAGIAVALRGGGLVAPALIGADALTLDEVMTAMRDLVSRARAGRLRSSEMTQGSLTISSLGDIGAEAMTGVIFPPQVALIGIGAPQRRPWVVGDQIAARTVVNISVAADHRVCDGRQAAKFLTELEKHLSKPEGL